VTTTCSSDAVNNVLELGADVALDYTQHDVMHELQQLQRYILTPIKVSSQFLIVTAVMCAE